MTSLEKGKSLFEQQKFDEAIVELTTFLKEQENNADALYTRAMCYRKIEQFENSVLDLNSILERLPEEPTLLCERGISHFLNKDIDAALTDMNLAVTIEPNNPFRYSSRAYIKAETDVNGAIADYEKAIELDPKDEISLNNLGLLQENAGKMNAAKKSFKKSNELIGYDPEKRTEKKEQRVEKIDTDLTEENTNSLGKIMLSVFTSKNARQEYFQFIKSAFRKKA